MALYRIRTLFRTHIRTLFDSTVAGNISYMGSFHGRVTPFVGFSICRNYYSPLMSSFHELFDLSTRPCVVGVRGDPCLCLIPFSLQNVSIFWFLNSFPLSARIIIGNYMCNNTFRRLSIISTSSAVLFISGQT